MYLITTPKLIIIVVGTFVKRSLGRNSVVVCALQFQMYFYPLCSSYTFRWVIDSMHNQNKQIVYHQCVYAKIKRVDNGLLPV